MSNLIHRLRCKYPKGPIIDGEPEFGWRSFEGLAPEGMMLPSPIMKEAAQRIEDLEKALNDLVYVAEQCDSWETFPSGALEDAQNALDA